MYIVHHWWRCQVSIVCILYAYTYNSPSIHIILCIPYVHRTWLYVHIPHHPMYISHLQCTLYDGVKSVFYGYYTISTSYITLCTYRTSWHVHIPHHPMYISHIIFPFVHGTSFYVHIALHPMYISHIIPRTYRTLTHVYIVHLSMTLCTYPTSSHVHIPHHPMCTSYIFLCTYRALSHIYIVHHSSICITVSSQYSMDILIYNMFLVSGYRHEFDVYNDL